MKILMIPTLNAPVVFYRMEQSVNELRKLGHEVAFSYRGYDQNGGCVWERKVMQDSEALKVFDDLFAMADVAVVQPVHTRGAAAMLHMMKDRHKKPMLIEMDDDPYSVTSMNPTDVRPGSEFEMWMDDHARLSDGMITSTPYLAEKFRIEMGKTCDVVPNAINFEIYDALKKWVRPRITAGWAGGAGHRLDLRLLEGVAQGCPDVQFNIFSGHLPAPSLRGKNMKQYHMTTKIAGASISRGKRWWRTMDKYPKWLASLGLWVGMAPLIDSTFNRAKSNLRWLEYSALGIPTVASPVEPFSKSILNGKTGILANDTDDWVRAIRLLTSDEGLRKEMGKLAQDKVRAEFNVQDVAKTYESILEGYC